MKQEHMTPPLGSSDIAEDIKPKFPEDVKAEEHMTSPPASSDIAEDIKPKFHEDIKAGTAHEAPSLPTPSPEDQGARRVLWEDRLDQQAAPMLFDRAPNFVQPLENANILVTYGLASQRLMLFDYDGTLTDIVPNPCDALLGEPVFDELRKLASHPKNTVWIISGRDRYFLEKEPGRVAELGLVAEHGAFMRYPGTTEWQDICGDVDMSWQDRVESVMRRYKAAYPLSAIERKNASVVWHYRNAKLTSDSPAEGLKTELERILGSNDPVEVKRGKCIVEVRLKFVNKGQIASKLAREYEPTFVLCAGDDVTDEGNLLSTRKPIYPLLNNADMFKALLYHFNVPSRHVFTVVIGRGGSATYAWWYIDEPVDLIGNIMMLIRCDRTGDTTGGMMTNGKPRGSRPTAVPRSHLIRANR